MTLEYGLRDLAGAGTACFTGFMLTSCGMR